MSPEEHLFSEFKYSEEIVTEHEGYFLNARLRAENLALWTSPRGSIGPQSQNFIPQSKILQ